METKPSAIWKGKIHCHNFVAIKEYNCFESLLDRWSYIWIAHYMVFSWACM